MTKRSYKAAERRAEKENRKAEIIAVLGAVGSVGIATSELCTRARHDIFVMRKDLYELEAEGVVQKSKPKKIKGGKIVRWRLRAHAAAAQAA